LTARAELLADGGATAAVEEFFRSTPFMAAEGVTHTLRIAAGEAELAAPLIVREIPGGGLDATSPYGFPGFEQRATSNGRRASLDPAEIDWSESGLVSAFIRHRIGEPSPLAGTTVRNTVFLADPALDRKSRPSDRQQIRKNLKRGYEVRAVPGPEVSDEELAGFHRAYTETMRRAAAAERYFYDSAYWRGALAFADSWLFLAIGPGGSVAAGSLVARSDGLLHYYLSGTADAQLRDSPMKNLVAAICDLGEEHSLPVNLGGGLAAGDALEEFKRGFANRSEEWHTSELVCDPPAYERLAAGREAEGFFPAYRAPEAE
jgi:Acetyltransferase (GNAT) domain